MMSPGAKGKVSGWGSETGDGLELLVTSDRGRVGGDSTFLGVLLMNSSVSRSVSWSVAGGVGARLLARHDVESEARALERGLAARRADAPHLERTAEHGAVLAPAERGIGAERVDGLACCELLECRQHLGRADLHGVAAGEHTQARFDGVAAHRL